MSVERMVSLNVGTDLGGNAYKGIISLSVLDDFDSMGPGTSRFYTLRVLALKAL